MNKTDAEQIYKKIKKDPSNKKYCEEVHCPMVLEVIGGSYTSTVAAFCVKAGIGERTFYEWVHKHKMFAECYEIAQAFAKHAWEKEGEEVRHDLKMGEACTYNFDYWRMMGWAKFGISKNNRIRLKLNPVNNAIEHYKELLEQAAGGEFTASEFKQLMEAINVGLNVHDKIEMQKQIDEIKEDVLKLNERENVNNKDANSQIARTGPDPLED